MVLGMYPGLCVCQASSLPLSPVSALSLLILASLGKLVSPSALPRPLLTILVLHTPRTHQRCASTHDRAADLGGQVEADIGTGHGEVPVEGAVGAGSAQAEGRGERAGQGQGTPQG